MTSEDKHDATKKDHLRTDNNVTLSLGRVLITGSSGFVGLNLVGYIASHGLAERIVLVDLVAPKEGAFAEYGGVKHWNPFGKNCSGSNAVSAKHLIVYVDSPHGYADRGAMLAVLESFSIERVIHLGGETSVDRSFSDPIACMTTNVCGTALFIQACCDYHYRCHQDDSNNNHNNDGSTNGITDDDSDGDDNEKYKNSSDCSDNHETKTAFLADSRVRAADYASSQSARDSACRFAELLPSAKNTFDSSHREGKQGRRLLRFMQMSTDEVFGDASEIPNREGAPFKPTNPYAVSKAASELISQSAMRSHGLPVSTLRSTNIFGPHQTWDKAIPAFVRGVIEHGAIALHGSGSQMRTWIHVNDVCSAIVAVSTTERPDDVYNIAGRDEMSIRALAEHIVSILDKPKTLLVNVVDRPHNDRFYRVDASYIREKLGWEPMNIPFTVRLAQTVWHYARALAPKDNNGGLLVSCSL